MPHPKARTRQARPLERLPGERLHNAEQSRQMDAWTIETLGVPGIVLMEHAGRAVADQIAQHLLNDAANRSHGPGPVVVLAGPGNNGGDGWVCARHLWGRAQPTVVLTLQAPNALQGDARLAAETFIRSARALGWCYHDLEAAWEMPDSGDAWCQRLDALQPTLVVDALFGTGLTRPLRPPADAIASHCQARDWPVWSVDLPSGLPTDGQRPTGPVMVAERSLTFGKRKLAHVSEPGLKYCGQVHVVDIGLHEPPRPAGPRFRRVPPLSQFPHPEDDVLAHKGRFGHVAVVAGAPRTRGAAHLAAHAALRVGAGLVTKLTPPPLVPEPAFPECMLREIDAADRLAGIDALVLGPGLGSGPELHSLATALLAEALGAGIPLVLDADALPFCLAIRDSLRGVATPHPGEAARLLDLSAQDIQADRIAAARALQDQSSGRGHELIWILKGASPVIAAQDGEIWICDGGAPPLAVGGSGDVLAGAIGALLASGKTPLAAALQGTRLHQEAGRCLRTEQERGYFASQISDMMGKLHNNRVLADI